MFYQPFNPETLKVYDLTRSTLTEPYELDYGFSDILDDTTCYTHFPRDDFFQCMLSPTERNLSYPHIFLTEQDLQDIINYSLKFINTHNDDYRFGYVKGYDDVVKFDYRKYFESIKNCTVGFLVGYEAGVYAAIMHRKFFKNFI